MPQNTIRRRLRSLRESRQINQEVLAQNLGFNDRQTLSDIERGVRNVSAAELTLAAQFFGVATDYFTDPFEMAGEARFSWRKATNNMDDLAAFESKAGQWIAAYRHLSLLRGDTVNSSLMSIDVTSKSSLPEASEEGEAVAKALELGEIPALELSAVLEGKLDTLVLNIDAESGVSGAACQLGPLNTIIINRKESEGRRSFDLGHEFFHLLTWDRMPPSHLEISGEASGKEKKIEQLADSFASGLLMPSYAIQKFLDRDPIPEEASEIANWIVTVASELRVSGQALKWRLVNLGLIKKRTAMSIEDSEIRIATPQDYLPPARFSKRFMEALGYGLEEGYISARKAAKVMCITVDDLADLFAEHGLRTPFDL